MDTEISNQVQPQNSAFSVFRWEGPWSRGGGGRRGALKFEGAIEGRLAMGKGWHPRQSLSGGGTAVGRKRRR